MSRLTTNPRSLVITGGTGLLGLNWAFACRDTFDVTLVGRSRSDIQLSGVRTCVCSLDSEGELSDLLNRTRAEILIHCAAMTKVDECERQPLLADYTNALLSQRVAGVCHRLGVKMVYISTDQVYKDRLDVAATEADETSPVNAYGRSKLRGEELVSIECPGALIIRTNFFGWGPTYRTSYSDYILRNVRNRRNIQLRGDIIFSPVNALELINITHELIDFEQSGVFNISSDDSISKYDFGLELCKLFSLRSDTISEIRAKHVIEVVPRPQNMILCNKKTCSVVGRQVGSINRHLKKLVGSQSDTWVKELTGLI